MVTLTEAYLNYLSYLNWHIFLSLTDGKTSVSEHKLSKTSNCLSASVTLRSLDSARGLVNHGNKQIHVLKNWYSGFSKATFKYL